MDRWREKEKLGEWTTNWSKWRCQIGPRDAKNVHPMDVMGPKMAQCGLSAEAARERACMLLALVGQAEAPYNETQPVGFRSSATVGPDHGRKRRCGRNTGEVGRKRRKRPDLAAEEGRGIDGASGTSAGVAAEACLAVRIVTALKKGEAKAQIVDEPARGVFLFRRKGR